jgi:hypothetical protein
MKQLTLFDLPEPPQKTRPIKTDKRAKGQLLPIPRNMDKPLKRGSKVCARHEITFADGSRIAPLTPGVIYSSGDIACNVHFSGYAKNHYVLCFWDMLLQVVS